jgi:hypothetical protein
MKTPTTNPSMRSACWSCVHRRDIPGDGQVQCAHPRANPLLEEGRISVISDARGVHQSYFAWPHSFDPACLKFCDGFTPQKKG